MGITIKEHSKEPLYVKYEHKITRYYAGSYIARLFSVQEFEGIINNDRELKKITDSGFDEIEILDSKTGEFVMLSLLKASKETLLKEAEKAKKCNSFPIAIYKKITPKDIDSFYSFYLTVEIRALQLAPKTPNRVESIYVEPAEYDKKHICVSCYALDSVNLNIGRRKVTDPWNDRGYVYLVPLKHIKKIKGTIRYKDNDWIGTDKESDYNGKTEEYILDLDHFDKDIYKVFTDHKMLEITNE